MRDDRERLVEKVHDAIYKVLNAPGRDPKYPPYHEAAEAAVEVVGQELFEVVGFGKVEAPRQVRPRVRYDGTIHVPLLLSDAFGISISEARRVITQGGVHVEGAILTDLDVEGESLIGRELRLGKRRKVQVVG